MNIANSQYVSLPAPVRDLRGYDIGLLLFCEWKANQVSCNVEPHANMGIVASLATFLTVNILPTRASVLEATS